MSTSIEKRLWENLNAEPERVAVAFIDPETDEVVEWSYKQFTKVVFKLIAELELMRKPGSFVAIYADKAPVVYALIAAATLVGIPFVPLSPRTPSRRLTEILKAFDHIILATDTITSPTANAALADLELESANGIAKVERLDLTNTSSLTGASIHTDVAFDWSPSVLSPDETAYIVFTSGSTGSPKGIVIKRKNLNAFIENSDRIWKLTSRDRISQIYELSFDPAIADVFWALTNSAAICPFSTLNLRSLRNYLEQTKPTVFGCSPSILEMAFGLGIGLEKEQYPSVRMSAFIGEKLPWTLATKWASCVPNSSVENHYGPAETTISISRYNAISIEQPGPRGVGIVPIGQAHPSHEFKIVDESGRIVEQGESGELVISGPQVGPGYWKDQSRTEYSFRKYGWDKQERVWYRTGDLVKQLSSGDFVFLQRTDHQVKILGARTELSEIENLMANAIGDARVLAIFVGPVQSLLEEASSGSYTVAVLDRIVPETILMYARSELLRNLPVAAVPKEFYLLEEVPLSANGKLNRKEVFKTISSGVARRLWPR